MLLIDELDKVDPAFEALLLEVLSAWQLSIPKLGTIKARTIPFVVLTSNEERRIGDPLRRRSFYVRFEYPSTEREIQILGCRASDCGLEVRRHTAAFARALRSLSLSKPPSISEILEMAQVMELLGITEVAPELRNVLLPVLVKTESDRRLLMIDDQWESLIYDAKKYLEEARGGERTVSRLNKVSWMSALGLLMFGFLAEAGESMETRVRRVSAYYVAHYAAVYRIPVGLVEAVIEVESAWRPDAVSDKGACGLMQLMPATAQRFSVSNPFNIEQNIRAGAEYLSYLSQLFNGDLRLVLAAYAAGEGRVQQRGLAYSRQQRQLQP